VETTKSPDGTVIAYERTGDGPLLVVAVGTSPVLVLGGSTSADWFHRTVQETANAVPGARLVMVEGYDHGIPPEVIAPVLTEFFLGTTPAAQGTSGFRPLR